MKHTHHASKDNIDTCKICGKDIRDEVHLRNGQTAASYYRELETENARLKELNREMKGMLEDVLYYELPSDVYATIKELLAKTGGEG